jgi:hypothetical protein
MRYLILVLALSILPLTGCAHKTVGATPVGQAALNADAVVVRVNEFQAAVIQYCGPGPSCAPNTIATPLFREVIQACISARTVLKSVPAGWQASVKATWAELKPKLAGITNVAIQAAFSAADALIRSL